MLTSKPLFFLPQALDAVEKAASLQRVCVNGQDVLLLVLSSLCGNLFDHGTLQDSVNLYDSAWSADDWNKVDLEHDSVLLQQSARLVTDAILSNGTKGLDMTSAVRSWRSLRHLAELILAVVTKSGYVHFVASKDEFRLCAFSHYFFGTLFVFRNGILIM